jgi:isoquinoline 1-oxidoreductase
MGLGGALFEAVQFADGKILNAGLSSYRVPRFSDVPKIEVVLLDRKDLPSAGAGEAAIIGVAPAIRNAILDAAGTVVNTLPMLPNGMLV